MLAVTLVRIVASNMNLIGERFFGIVIVCSVTGALDPLKFAGLPDHVIVCMG